MKKFNLMGLIYELQEIYNGYEVYELCNIPSDNEYLKEDIIVKVCMRKDDSEISFNYQLLCISTIRDKKLKELGI